VIFLVEMEISEFRISSRKEKIREDSLPWFEIKWSHSFSHDSFLT
jgi:hypothetical protein